MENKSRAGLFVGVLIILQMVGSGLVNLVMEAPLFVEPGFLVNAASHSQQIGLAALIGLISAVVWLGIAVTVFPVFFQYSQRMTLWLLALVIVVAAIGVVENIGVLSMLSVSEAYAKAGNVEREYLQAVQIVVSSPRNWSHFIVRIFAGSTNLVFYAVLFRFSLIPRIIAGFGVLAAILMITVLTLTLFGYDVIFPLLAPMGLSNLAAALWLMAKGFRGQPQTQILG